MNSFSLAVTAVVTALLGTSEGVALGQLAYLGADGNVKQSDGSSLKLHVGGSYRIASLNNTASDTCMNMERAGTHTIQIISSGKSRSFDIFVPQNLHDNTIRPALFMWHGFAGTPKAVMEFTGINKEAENSQWYAVYPKGSGLIRGFNGAGCCPGVSSDDVQFARDIIAWLKANTCVDESKVYSTGFSNGGFMSNRLACEVPELFAGIAPHSGTMGKTFACNPTKGIPVLMFHGDSDPTVPFFGNGQWMSFEEVAAKWAKLNECGDESNARESFTSQTTTCVRYDKCGRDNVPFEYCAITGLAHKWSGEGNYDVDATDYLFQFFKNL